MLASVMMLAAAAAAQAFTADDLVQLHRLSDPQVSPDSRYVAYVLSKVDLAENKRRTDIWLLDLEDPRAEPRQLTQHPANDSSPRWSADSQTIYFLSTRSGSSQI